ncbi:MAG: IPT/TIG domain-containing protein [Terriglobales bacterium]
MRLSSLLYRAFRCAAVIPLFTVVLPLAQAGGPKYIAGISYFNSGLAGTPLTWSGGAITYYTDQGDLSPILPGPSADAFVASALSQWTSIPIAAVVATHGGQLAENVSGANVYVNPDGTITMPADIEPSATATPLGVVYDEDGTVTDALLGQGAGDPSECFYNAAYGGDDNLGVSANFLHALVVLNGNCAQTSSQLPDVEYRLVRVLGRVLGLDWSQLNLNVLTGNPPPTDDDYAGFPVMHQTDPPNCIPITLCFSNPYQPKIDDQAALARLYPANGNFQNFSQMPVVSAGTARIHGKLFFTTSSGQAAQAMQGVNVIARWIDPSTGLPSHAISASSVSGFLFCGNAGNTVTGFNDSSGEPLNQFGSNDTTLEGSFDLGGLQIPNGGTTAQFQLTVEAIDPFWSYELEPYGPTQVEPSGQSSPMLVDVSLGNDTEQDILMQSSAVSKSDPFPPTTYQTPAAVPLGGDWMASFNPYGDIDYFQFTGQGNRTLSVFVTALDEMGKASESKSQPVIGVWALSDPENSPAPAYTPSAFNSSVFGMTMLNAQLLQATNFRIGISDIRGDGRPDYRYLARILYGDQVNPARASVAGGTALAISGLGFQANTRITIANVIVPPLAISAAQALITAPAMADGVQTIALADPPTLASSVLSGVLTYGAGPTDTLVLIPLPNPSTPVGGQAPNPVEVRVLAADGKTPVQGASVVFTSSPAAGFGACSGASTCTVLSDQDGQASSFVTVLAAGAMTITAQLAPGSYSSPQQVQTTLVGRESALDIALAPQTTSIMQGASVNLALTARVLSNGFPLSGSTVNFQVFKGSAGLSASSVTTNSNGYASTLLEISSMAGDVQVSACVGPGNSPCLSFYGTSVPASVLQLQPVAGSPQVVTAGHAFQPVMVRVTDSSNPPDPVLAATVAFQFAGERVAGDSTIISAGDTNIHNDPSPVILFSGQTTVQSDANGLASWQPTTEGFEGDVAILGAVTAGAGQLQFALQALPPP